MKRALVLLVAMAGPMAAEAQTASSAPGPAYPSKPIRFIVGFPPGGATDLVARTISQKLADALGQPVVVDNRPGAASNIAGELVAASPKDGHTLFLGTVSTSINPTLYKKLPYDPLRDFAPVTQVTSTPFVVAVHPSLPVRSVKDLIARAKASPGKLAYASAGSGSGAHLFVEMFAAMTQVKLVHVPYKGAAPATTATMSGETQVLFDNVTTTLPVTRSGKLRGLAVTTMKRSAAAPELPTAAEAGVPGYDANAWFGMFVPAGTPQSIIDRLHAETVKTVKLPETHERFLSLGAEPVGSTPAEFFSFFRSEVAKWGKVVKASGAQVD
jgi:tripartite-type tricarboxylate transporter receptor subunit TctC